MLECAQMGRLIRLALVVLIALISQPVGAAKDYTALKLVVVSAESGRPVPRAAVTVSFVRGKKTMHLRKDRAEWDLKTDSSGLANLPDLPSGQVRVTVFAKGFQTFGEDFDVSGREQTITVKLLRPGEQFSAHETPEERRQKEKNEPAKKPE